MICFHDNSEAILRTSVVDNDNDSLNCDHSDYTFHSAKTKCWPVSSSCKALVTLIADFQKDTLIDNLLTSLTHAFK